MDMKRLAGSPLKDNPDPDVDGLVGLLSACNDALSYHTNWQASFEKATSNSCSMPTGSKRRRLIRITGEP